MRRTNWKAGRALLPAAVAATAIGVFLASAPAALAANCPPPPALVHPFLAWGDANDYVPVTGGSFEPANPSVQWSLSRTGASIVDDNEPWHVNGSAGGHALSLQTGGQATSACTTAPHIASIVRFFVKNTGSPSGELHVQLLVNGGKNGILDGGYVTAGSDWQPTDIVYLPWAHPLQGAVDLRVVLTPVGAGASFAVDDVYIDPCISRIG